MRTVSRGGGGLARTFIEHYVILRNVLEALKGEEEVIMTYNWVCKHSDSEKSWGGRCASERRKRRGNTWREMLIDKHRKGRARASAGQRFCKHTRILRNQRDA
jgi:hypothetical protein